jgi:hypothetical protein
MDARTLELIHGDLDGANGPEEQRELLSRLEASAEARREHECLRELNERLGSEPAFEPPIGLREEILARLPRPSAKVVPLRPRRAWLGVAAALAATVAGVALILDRTPGFQELDPAMLAGTLGRSATEARAPSLLFAEAQLSGQISLRQDDGIDAIEIDLDAGTPVEIVASAAGVPLELAGFVRIAGEPAEFAASEGQIRVLHRGHQHYALVLRPGDSRPTSIDFSIHEGERLVREDRLAWPAGGTQRRD